MLTIEIHLPAAIHDVADVLEVVCQHWPTSTIDLNGPNGWLIKVPPLE